MLNWSANAHELKQITDVLKDILSECWFTFDQDTITMKNVDPEKVVAVSLFMRPDKNQYQCPNKFVFPFYIQTLYRIFRAVKPNDTCTITQGIGGTLQISIFSQTKMLKNEIVMQPLQTDIIDFHQVQHHYDVNVDFQCQDLYHILHDLSSLSRKITIQINGQDVSFSAEDDFGTNSTYKQSFSILNYRFKGTYLAKYLEKFCKPVLSKSISLKISNGSPLTVCYDLVRGSLMLQISQSE